MRPEVADQDAADDATRGLGGGEPAELKRTTPKNILHERHEEWSDQALCEHGDHDHDEQPREAAARADRRQTFLPIPPAAPQPAGRKAIRPARAKADLRRWQETR